MATRRIGIQTFKRSMESHRNRVIKTRAVGALALGFMLAAMLAQSMFGANEPLALSAVNRSPEPAKGNEARAASSESHTVPSGSGMAKSTMNGPAHPAGSMDPLRLTSRSNRVTAFTNPLSAPPVLTATDITLEAREAEIQILPGAPTLMWTYNGTFPGPTILRPTGQTTNITLINSLSAEAGSLTLHNHCGHTSPESDGQTDSLLIPPGESRTYTYTGLEDGGNERGTMQFYHDHRMDVTARNLWMGMAGLYILDDPADPQTLPSGEFDVPLAVMDRAFDENNQLVYQFNPGGVVGDTILVNGVVQPYFEVADRKYRFRILNAANFSTYDLQLSSGQPMLQIGTESGLLPVPVSRTHILLGPAERADVVVDFAGQLGQNIVLNNLAGSGSIAEIMEFRVTSHVTDNSAVPSTLRTLPVLGTPVLTRTFEFSRTGSIWTINGLGYDPNRLDAQPVLGTTEKWILHNTDASPHVIHVHSVDQLLVSRNGNPPEPYELMKESWNISGNQTVEVLIKFTDHLGLYVFHCHLVEHEDARMMMQIEVVADPIPPTATPTSTHTPTGPIHTPTGTPTPACSPTMVGVVMDDNFFSPQTITVTVGTTVRWTNVGNRVHTATSDTDLWDSGILLTNQTFDYYFNSIGTFPYFCVVHGSMRGTVVVVGCASPTPTPTNTPTNTPTGTPVLLLVGHVMWQGAPAQPNARQQQPITLTLKLGTSEVNYPSQNTDAGGFFTVDVSSLISATYDWRVKGAKFLANSGTVSLTGVSTTQVDMGLMRAGDANGDNLISISDFNILKSAFGTSIGDPGYDARADFNNDGTISVSEFNLLKGNFGQLGASHLR